MKKMFWMGLGMALLVAACGKKGDPDAPKGGICDHVADEGGCEEFKSSALGLAEGFCKAAGGSYVKDKACPKDNLLGTCAKESGDKNMLYAGNGKNMTAEDGKKDCESNSLSKGKWTDGPAAATSKERKAPEAAKIKASCDKSEELSSCDDYSVQDALDLNKSMCEGMKGKYEKKGCPSDKLVGSCVYPTGRTTRYYVPKKDGGFGMTGADHKKDCEMEMLGTKGFWIDGPEFNTKPAGAASSAATPTTPPSKGTPVKPATTAKPPVTPPKKK